MAEYIKKEDIEQKIQDGLNNLVLGHDAIEVLGMIYEMPAADVTTVVHGWWINNTMIDGHIHAECSECHKVRIIDNYCSNCGAKMMEG